jgi:hypothetical protein
MMTRFNEAELLRKNIKDLQGQLRNAYIRIKELTDALHEERKRAGHVAHFKTDAGWAMPNENPDAQHTKEKEDE